MADIFSDPFAPVNTAALDSVPGSGVPSGAPASPYASPLAGPLAGPLDGPLADPFRDGPFDEVRQPLSEAFRRDDDDDVLAGMDRVFESFSPAADATAEGLLSAPKDPARGPTAFQRREINWSDGGRSPDAPVAYAAAPSDFLEVDYMHGRKEGASDKPVLAANVFGRQFTAEELSRDDEGRRLLGLMKARRSGEYSKGGTLANLAKGFTDWSASDIPYYGWVSDVGATAGEAIEISETLRRLQDGRPVTPHRAIQARRFMLQQELESQRSMAYQIGSVARQAIPFMAEMFIESALVGAATGAVAGGGVGAIPGAIAGAAIAPFRVLLGMLRKAAPKAAAKVTDRAMARYAAKGLALTAADRADFVRRSVEAYGSRGAFRDALRGFRSQAQASGAAATRRGLSDESVRLMADALSRRAPERLSPAMAARMMLGADYRTGAETAIARGLEDLALRKAGVKTTEFAKLSGGARAKKVAEGWGKVSAADRDAYVKAVLDGIGSDKAAPGIRDALGGAAGKGARDAASVGAIRGGMGDTTGLFVSEKYARAVADQVVRQALNAFDLRYGSRHLSHLQRLKGYLGEHVARGFLQSEHAFFAGGRPTIGHAGFSSFHLTSDALKEGLGRVFIEAPIQGAMNAAVGPVALAPVFSLASGHGAGDAVFKGQLGFQANALLTGDTRNMETARQCAIGSLFVEYMSESAGRGLGPMVGGALASNPVARAVLGTKARPATGTTASVTGALTDAWDAFLKSPLTKRAGSTLSRAVEAVYGFGRMPVDKYAELATSYVSRLVRAANARGVDAAVSQAAIRNAVTSRSLDGLGEGVRRVLADNGVRTAAQLARKVALDASKGDRVKALANVLGLRLAMRGYTPDRIIQTFRQMGKGGGVIEEMGEERIGDFVRGLFHLDDTASDADIGDHVRSMFSGFLDPEQLGVEFFGFALPGIARSGLIRAQRWIGDGVLAEARERAARVRNVMGLSGSSGAALSVSADARAAEAVRAHVAEGRRLLAEALGDTRANEAAVTANAPSVFAGRRTLAKAIRDEGGLTGGAEAAPAEGVPAEGLPAGGVPAEGAAEGSPAGAAPVADYAQARAAVAAIEQANSEGEVAEELSRLAGSYMRYESAEELDEALRRTGARVLFGDDGVRAIRREWRKADGHRFAEGDEVETALAAYSAHMARPAAATVDTAATTVEELADQARVDCPILSSDSSATASQREAQGGDTPLADEGVAETLAEDLAEITRSVNRAALSSGGDAGFGRRAVSKVLGILGALTTGDISLAVMNPAAWQVRDAGLPPNLMLAANGYYTESLIEGFRRLREGEGGLEPAVAEALDRAAGGNGAGFAAELARLSADGALPLRTLEAMEEAGRGFFESRIRRLSESVLAGSGIIMVTRGQSDEAVLRFVAARHRRGDRDSTVYVLRDGAEVADFHDPRFAESYAPEIAQVRNEMTDALIRLAADRDALRYTRGARLGSDSPFLSLDVVRALRNGTQAEMLGAMLSLPAFRDVAKVLNVSGLSEYERETLFSAMSARDVDLTAVANVDDTHPIEGGDEALVASAMGRDLPRYTDAENQRAMRDFVRRCRLLHRGGTTTFTDLEGLGREARIIPGSEGGRRSYRAVVRAGGRMLLDADFADYASASEAIRTFGRDGGYGFAEDSKRLVVSDLNVLTSTDAASLVSYLYGNDREALRRQYLRRLGGDDAVRRDRLLADVAEATLPPYLRRRPDGSGWLLEGDGAAAAAARAFREEAERARYYERNKGNPLMWGRGRGLALAERRALMEADAKVAASFAAYEKAGSDILSDHGVTRTVTPASQALGLGEAWTAHLNYATVQDGNVLVVSPDFVSDGHSEGLLRYGIRQALESWRGVGADATDRSLLLAYAYREFRRCGEELAAELERTDRVKARRVRDVLAKTLRTDTAQIHVASLAAIASSSVLFSCDRGLMQEGNGFLDGPELAAVADRFRGTAVFPLFASAIDEALGGTGFFHRSGARSVDGLAAWVQAFAQDDAAVTAARRSTVFGDGREARNPALVRYVLGPHAATPDAAEAVPMALASGAGETVGADGLVRSFSGVARYLRQLSDACVAFTDAYAGARREEVGALTAAQAYRMAVRSGLLGGASTSEGGAKAKIAAGLIRQSAAMEADAVTRRRAPYEMPPEASRHLGAALRRVAVATGLTKTGGRARLLGALRDMCVPEEVVAAVEDAYNETDLVAETRRFEAGRRERTREEEVDDEAGRADDSYQEERNIAGLVDNDDLGALSRIVRWLFPAEGGNVSATLQRIRGSLIGLGMLADANVARAVRSMPDAERVSANVRRFVDALSVGDDRAGFGGRNASSVFWSPDQREVSQVLDDVVRVLTAMGKTEYAISVAAIRNIPSRDGRRTKVLQMAAQMNVCDPVFVTREGGGLSVRPMDRLVDSNRASNVIQGLYGSLLRVRAAVRRGGWVVDLTGDTAESLAEGIVGALEVLTPKPKRSMASTLTAGWGTIDPALRANWVDIDAAPKYRPGGTEYSVAVDAGDLAAVLDALKSGTSADAAEALDRIQALTWRRMQNMAEAVDLILGTGSTPAAMLRSRDTLAYIRAAADRALDTVVDRQSVARRLGHGTGKADGELDALVDAEVRRLDAVRRTGVEQFLQMANYFATSKRTNRHAGVWSTQHCSAFLADLLQDPLAQLAMRLGAPEAGTADGFIQPSGADGVRAAVADGIAKAVSDGRLGKTPRDVVRAMLLDIGALKAATDLNVSRALTPERMTQVKAGGFSYDPSRMFATSALRVLVNGYLSSLPQGSRSLGGYVRDRREAQENRAVTTLPSDLPAELRAYNHPLFGVKVDGKTLRETLEENGGRWPDGSRPLVAVVGAKDYDGSLLPKEYLAGVLDAAIREGYASGGPTHVLVPLFRADKPSCFAFRLPRRIAEEWVRQVAADEGLTGSLRPQVADAVRRVAGAAPARSADAYDAVAGLMLTAAGQADIDPKRVATTLAVAPIVPMYRPLPEGAAGEEPACHFVSVIGGATGASLTGAYQITGCGAENVRTMSEGNPESQKLHITSHALGVTFKKGQGNDYGLGFDETGDVSTLASVRYYQAQARRYLEGLLGLDDGSLDPAPRPEGADADALEAWRRDVLAPHVEAVKAAREFLKTSTVVIDDLETNKAGIFGSSFGFAWDGKGPFTLSLMDGTSITYDPKTRTVVDGGGKALSGGWNVAPDAKNGQMPLLWGLSALCMAKGDGLTAGDVESVTARWRLMNGTVTGPMTLRETGVLADGDRFTVRDAGDGSAVVAFRTRNIAAQVVANNANGSAPEYGHTFAANATRDMELLDLLNGATGAVDEKGSRRFVAAHTAYSALVLSSIHRNPELAALACGRDRDLAEAYRAHPFDPEVRDVVARKVMAFVRREGFIGFYGAHGVMCPSAGNGHTPVAESRGGHTVRIEWLPGTTQYDKDMFRPARIFNTREVAFYGQSRDLGSGCVNARYDGFRYGLFLDEEAFGRLELPDGEGAGRGDDGVDAAEWAAIEGCDVAEAETAKRLVRAIRAAVADNGFRADLLACFTDYTGRRAAGSAGSRNARFDDLFIGGPGGRFDLTAVNIGRSRRNPPGDRGSATGRIYLCGSPFIAHRSPSGNVESFQGIVRATAPVTFNANTGLPGREAKYALDPVTMLLQGSDTDGDSAGLQFLDYSASFPLTQDDLESVARSDSPLREAERLGWTERVPVQTADGETTVTVVRDEVLRAVMREAFDAQLEAHRRAATFHQGQQDAGRVPPKSRAYAAEDVWSGAEFADHYAAERPEYLMTREMDNEFLCDYAWAGRQPVGTDAVWDEQVDPGRLDGLSAKARAILARVDGAERMTYDRLLKAYVDAAGYGEKTDDLVSPDRSAMLSDAASDSAKARGVSVFNQARIFRALARNLVKGVRVDLVAPDGYAPLVDFISHVDGVSNNLFDTLKMMFATRAGWTVQMLPYLFGYTLQYAPKARRLDNAFFFTMFANFLANLKDPASPLARLASFLDPVKGRENIVREIERLGYGGEGVSLYNSVEANAHECCRKAGVEVLDGRGRPRTPTGRDAVLCVAAWRRDRRTPTQAEGFLRAMRTATADVARVNAPIDYMTLAGKGWADITERGTEAQEGLEVDGPIRGFDALAMQHGVTALLGATVGRLAETAETIEEAARSAEADARETAKREGRRFERWGGGAPARGPDFASNVQRLAHLAPMAARAREFAEAFGGTAYGFVSGFAEAVRRLSAEAWRRYDGRTDKPIGRLLRAIDSRRGRIGLRSRMSEADIERLREGFAALATYAGEFTLSYGEYGKVRTMRRSGKDVADMLVVFAGMTQPYGASTSYYGQSNLPAVFGDAVVASLETGARLVYADGEGNAGGGRSAFLRAARVKPVGTPAGAVYDVMAPEFRALAGHAQAVRPGRRADEPNAVYARLAGSLEAVRVRVTALRGGGGESVAGERIADGPVPAPEFGGRMDVRTVFRDGNGAPVPAFRPTPASTELYASPEEAYNRMLALEEARLTAEGAEEELAYYRRYLAENGRAVSDAGGRAARSLTRLIADAAARVPEVYGVVAGARGRFITHKNPAMQEALNSVADRIMSGSIAEPAPSPVQGAKARLSASSAKGGESAEGGGSADLVRGDLLDRIGKAGVNGASRRQMRRTIPDAIADAFRRVFGDGVEVAQVRNADGRPTSLVKVVRRLKGGKSLATYISYGDALGLSGVGREDRIASLLDAVNAAREAKGLRGLSVADLSALSGHDLDALAESVAAAGLQLGQSDTAANLGFAPIMSGLIRLSADAGFDTLFHEYFHQMLACYRMCGVCADADMEALAEAFPAPDGRFDEEAAADAYARFVTGGDGGWDAVALKDADRARGDVKAMYRRFRSVAEELAAATYAGPDETGMPVFVYATMFVGDLTDEQAARLVEPSARETEEFERFLLGQGGRFSQPGLPADRSSDVRNAVAAMMEELTGRADPSAAVVSDAVGRARRAADAPVEMARPAERAEAEPVDDRAGGVDVDAPGARTAAGRISAFIRTALSRYRWDAGAGAVRELLGRYSQEAIAGNADASRVVFTVRRFIREVSVAVGYALEDADGRLTQFGKEILSDATVSELAAALILSANREREAEARGGPADDGYERLPLRASSDYAFARALEYIAPGAYAGFCIDQAKRSGELFARLSDRLAAAARALRGTTAGNDRLADSYELQSQELRGLADRVVELTAHVVNGDDLHSYLPDVKNAGNLHGMLFKAFTGGATFGEKHAGADGIGRYDAGQGSSFHFDLSDPTVTAAYDYAAMAFFVAEAARKYRRLCDLNGKSIMTAADPGNPSEGAAPGGAETAGEAPDPRPSAPPVQPMGPFRPGEGPEVAGPDTLAIEPPDIKGILGYDGSLSDAGEMAYEPDTTPDWILSNPGTWLDADLLGAGSGADMRGMLTDHTVKAACEEAYAFCNTMNQTFGLDTWRDGRVREMKRKASGLGVNAEGDLAKGGAGAAGRTSTVFSSTRGALLGMIAWSERRVGEPCTADDLRLANWTCQAIGHLAARDRRMITGISIGNLAAKDDLRRLGPGWRELMSPAAVIGRHRRPEGGDRSADPETALDLMLYRILVDLPVELTGAPHDAENADAPGLYRDVVEALRKGAAAAEKAAAEGGAPQYQACMERELRRIGLVASGGGRSVVTVPISRTVEAWNGSGMYRKLRAAGRPDALLNPHYWANLLARQYNAVNVAASKSRYLVSGLGSNLTLAGTSSYWFHGGTGAYAMDVSAYRSALETIGDAEASVDSVLRAKERTLFGVLESVGTAHLRSGAFGADGQAPAVKDRTLRYLAYLVGATGRDDSSFDVRGFVADVLAGRYASPERGCALTPDMTALDVYMLINRVVSERTLNALAAGGSLAPADRQDLVDRLAIVDRLASRLAETVPGTICARSEEQEFAETGRLGSSMTGAERLVAMCKELVTAERFRGGLAQMLVSVADDGTPNYVVNPTDAAVAVSGLGDDYWGMVARFAIRHLRFRYPSIAYDEGKSGVQNMRDVYAAVSATAVGGGDRAGRGYHALDAVKMRADGMLSGILCSNSGVDTAGNSNVLTDVQGGEADCYMRQLFSLLKSPSVDSAWQKLDRLMSWTKIASVGFSAFFNVATVFESATAATGFWHTVMGMTKTGARAARAVGKALGRKGGTGAFTSDAVLMADLAEYLNSDDPFVRRARELCDLIGMPLDPAFPYRNDRNASNPVLGQGGVVKADIEKVVAWASAAGMGPHGVKMLHRSLRFMYEHPTDYTFSVVLNAVKMSVVLQTMRRLREECLRGARPFDPVRELRRHAAYINAEIGGIDPAQYAWATPQMRKILSLGMFSWQWTMGAWVAGGGEAISDAVFGGHSSKAEQRQRAFIRWLRMLGIVKFGVPVVLQAAIKALSKATALAGGIPPDDELAGEIERMPWFCPLNESKAGSLSFDVTPLLKLAARVPGVAAAKDAVPVIGPMIPAYTGGGRNTTGHRRYYMHFGKQSDEFFRWFEDPLSQAIAKTSIPVQKVFEGIFGGVNPQGFRKSFADKGFIDRIFNLNFSADENALVNLLSSMSSFSAQSISANPDAGILAAVGPMKMGESKRSTRLRIVNRLRRFVEDDRSNNPWSYAGNRRRLNLLCADILREGALDGVPPDKILSSALGDLAKEQYAKLMDALPKDIRVNRIDGRKAVEAVRALSRLDKKLTDIRSSVLQKYEDAGYSLDRSPAMRKAVIDVIRAARRSPAGFGGDDAERLMDEYRRLIESEVRSDRMDAKGGEGFGNLLATDAVPATLFGVPVVSDGYTETDTRFFRDHPEAGGFYEMGGEPPEPPGPADGGPADRGDAI